MKTTLQEKAYNWIIQKIYSGELKAGDPLRVEAFASQIGISMTPVREALARLEKEGITENIPYCGCKIRKLSSAEKEELFLFRGCIEAACVEKAIERCGENSFRELDKIVDEMEFLLKNTSMDDKNISSIMIKNDMDFHNKIIEISGCSIVAGFARSYNILAHSVLISLELERFRGKCLEVTEHVISQHRAIITAMRLGWKRAAAELAREHVAHRRESFEDKRTSEDEKNDKRKRRKCIEAS